MFIFDAIHCTMITLCRFVSVCSLFLSVQVSYKVGQLHGCCDTGCYYPYFAGPVNAVATEVQAGPGAGLVPGHE